MPTHPSPGGAGSAGLTHLFDQALSLLRQGEHRAAHRVAQEIVRTAPENTSASLLLLATSGTCGDDETIEDALLVVSDHYEELVALPEFLAFLESELLAPVVRTRMFRQVFAPSFWNARRRLSEVAPGRPVATGQVLDALGDAVTENVLSKAPVFRAPEDGLPMNALQLVDGETGLLAAVLSSGGPYVGGRSPEADVILAHPSVSRAHFNIASVHETWFIQNLSRTNGTQINGWDIGDGWARLSDGDELQIGDVRLEVGAARLNHDPRPRPPRADASPEPVTQARPKPVRLAPAQAPPSSSGCLFNPDQHKTSPGSHRGHSRPCRGS